MRFHDFKIQTQRETPKNARSAGFALLVRAGMISRDGHWLPLGEQSLARLLRLPDPIGFTRGLSLTVLGEGGESFVPMETGPNRVLHCNGCGYTARREFAQFKKEPFTTEDPLPLERASP